MAREYGDDAVGFAKAESTLGVLTAPAAGDAFYARDIDLQPADYDRVDPGDRRGTYTPQESIEGRHRATWRVLTNFRPSGSLGVAPDIGELLTLAFGTETVNASTNVIYSQLKNREAIMASIWRQLTNTVQFCRGCVCESLTITADGTGLVTFDFRGSAVEYGESAPMVLSGIHTTTAILTVVNAKFADSYSIFEVNDDDTAHVVTATGVDRTNNKVTIGDTISAADAVAVNPYLPTGSFTGDPIHGVKHSVSLDGGSTTYDTTGFTLVIATNMSLDNREGGTTTPHDVINGKFSVTGDIKFAVEAGTFDELDDARQKAQFDVRLTVGDTATKRCKFDLDVVEFTPVPLSVPESGMVEVTLPFTAYGSSDSENAVTATLD